MRKIGHIINPVLAPQDKSLAKIQPITFASILRARSYAKNIVNVDLMTTQYPEDRKMVPKGFRILPDLTINVENILQISSDRKLPLLVEILQKAAENSDAEYLVYSNVDIGLDPPFYLMINKFLDQGIDGMIFHRRRLSGHYISVDQLDEIYSDRGLTHTGFDTFVFRRNLVDKFILGNICLGVPHVGNALAHNLFAFCGNFKSFSDKHLTFHIGLDLVKTWGCRPYLKHNKREFRSILKSLRPQLKIENIPASNENFCRRHFIWLMNPNYHYPTLCALDLTNFRTPRNPKPSRKDHPRGYYEWLVRKIKTKD